MRQLLNKRNKDAGEPERAATDKKDAGKAYGKKVFGWP